MLPLHDRGGVWATKLLSGSSRFLQPTVSDYDVLGVAGQV